MSVDRKGSAVSPVDREAERIADLMRRLAALERVGHVHQTDVEDPADNLIINSAFDIWQRGGGAFTADGYSADQWVVQPGGATTQSMTRQTFALGNTIPGYEPTYYCRSVVAAGAGTSDSARMTHRIESVRRGAGQTVCVSFWAKANTNLFMSAELAQIFGTGGSPSANVTGIGATKFAITSTWARYSVVIDVPSISGKTVGTTHDGYLQLCLWFDAGSTLNSRTASLGHQSGTFDVWGVKVEESDHVTNYRQPPLPVEMPKCLRYFWRNNPGSNGHVNVGHAFLSTAAIMPFQHPIPMRAGPTASLSANGHWALQSAGGVGQTVTGFSTANSSPFSTYTVPGVASGLVAGNATGMVCTNSAGYIQFSAEL